MKDPKTNFDPENPFDPADAGFSQAFGEQWSGPEHLDMARMNQSEEEEFLLHYGPRNERKALKKRQKAERRAANEKKRWFDR